MQNFKHQRVEVVLNRADLTFTDPVILTFDSKLIRGNLFNEFNHPVKFEDSGKAGS